MSKLILDSRSSRIDFNLELNNVTNTYKHKCYLHSMVSEVELGNRDNLARAVHCSNELSALVKIQALLRKVPIRHMYLRQEIEF